MREIKFRAWEPVNSTMLDVVSFNIELQTIQSQYDEEHKLCNIELMQYTGLKDKNGVEIYEGDIVKYKQRGVMELMTVCWNEEDAKFSFVDGGDDWYYVIEGCEVIGNIYEDKELL